MTFTMASHFSTGYHAPTDPPTNPTSTTTTKDTEPMTPETRGYLHAQTTKHRKVLDRIKGHDKQLEVAVS